MRHFRFVILMLAIVAVVGVESGARRLGQATPASEARGPFDSLHFRSIGPASMSGRISDIAVYEADPAIFYVGTAHGGVWKTTNNGTTFEAELQHDGLMSVGDVAVSQSNPDLVWVGTGESNNRQSTSWGDGIFKSTDGGRTWTNMGLRTSRYIGRIVIDPRDNDTVYVAAAGSLWGPGGERGVFKTVDGGKTWKQVLKVDDDTGANDLVMDSTNNRVLYAATYQRRRAACCMNGGGPGSGIWKSTDAGETWARLTKGIPAGPLGRIGIDVSRLRPDILYAVIEGPAPEQAGPPAGGRGGRFTRDNDTTPTGLYRSDDAGATWRKVNNADPRPMYFSQVRVDPNDPDVVIFGGVNLQMTTDGGKTVNTQAASKIHSDHHAIWIDPSNSKHVIIGNDGGLAVSWDRAGTWNFLPNLPVGLFYHVSYDFATPYHVCGGMQDNYVWCGPSAVRGAAGIANYQWTTVQGGDGFVALQDPSDYRVAFSESQDGNMMRVDRVTNETVTMRPLPGPGEPPLRWNWDTPLIQSPEDAKVLYTAANRVFRSPDRGLSWTPISPDLTSNANRDDIVTMGLKGSDIHIAKNDGIEAWPTIVSLAESPKRAGLLYAGTDDGNLQVTRDDGKNWTNITANVPNLPKGVWVSEVVPSRFDEGTVYATFDGHRQNDFGTYIYVSTDYGRTWQSAAANLKDVVVKTLTEDTRNPDVLYIGTETGLYASVDRAKSWIRIKANLPDVRIDEIAIHPRDNAMILATHGRALWILDHLEPIQEYAKASATTTDAKLFTTAPAMYRRPARDRNYEFWGDQTFFGENPPEAAVISWYRKGSGGDVKLEISDATGHQIREIAGKVLARSNTPGIQSACWDLRVDPAPALPPPPGARPGQAEGETQRQGEKPQAPENTFGAGCAPAAGGFGGFGGGVSTLGPVVPGGVYTVSLVIDGKVVDKAPVHVNEDPEVVLTSLERKRMFDMAMEIHALQRPVTDAVAAEMSLSRQMTELGKAIGERKAGIPADVRSSFDAFGKDLKAIAARISEPPRFGGGSAPDNILAKIGQAKNGLMAGMTAGQQTMRAYNEVKADAPKAIADMNAVIAKAGTLSAELTKYDLKLDVPKAVTAPEVVPGRKSRQP
ncbi:MAG: WD40/YVTN/BNR-like repeat-containing protein [Betaproteobacteria bacterium]